MTDFAERLTKVGRSTSDGISPGRGTVQIRLALKDGTEGVILNLCNVYYLPNSPSNLVSLSFLNDAGIYYDNEQQALYNKASRRPFAFTQRWERSFLLHPLNLSVSAANLLKTEDNLYQDTKPKIHQTWSVKLPLTIWHKQFGHLNFPALRKHLAHHNICYTNDEHICDSCKRAKATKHYNCTPQERAKRPYQFVYTDLVGPMTPLRFGAKSYFFTFSDDNTRITETYTGRQKSKWLKSLKAFYNLVCTCTGLDRPIERLRSDYESELQSRKVDKWLTKQEITFEPSAPYSQEENGVSKKTRRTIMDLVRATILEGGIDDTLWPGIVLAMTYIKNLRPTRALEGFISPIEMQTQAIPDLHHLRILDSNVHVFLHEEKQSLKSAKWEARALRGKLVGFDGLTIYRAHIKDQNKVIRVKDLRIYEDITSKGTTALPDFEGVPTFDAVQMRDEQTPSEESSAFKEGKNARKKPSKKPAKARAGSKKDRASEKENEPKTTTQRQSRTGKAIKPTAKTRNNTTIHALVMQLSTLLENWDQNAEVSAFLASYCDQGQESADETLKNEEDPLYILAASIQKANATNPADFSSSSELDVKELETYKRAMSGPHAQKWAHAI